MNLKYKKVAVLYGGTSDEREVSLKSGEAVANSLIDSGVDVTLLDWDHNAFNTLSSGNFEAVVIMLHGGEGEDGTVQALLESLQIPYTGSGATSCLLSMDKASSKYLWQSLNIPTLPFEVITKDYDIKKLESKFTYPICVKAANLGSSIGVYCAHNTNELKKYIAEAKLLDKKVIIEPWIGYKEYTVSFFNNKSLPSIWIESKEAFYDYDAKYNSQSTKYHCPSDLSKDQEEYVQQLATKAFQSLGCQDFGRVDLLCDKDQNFYVMEVNTVPGMTARSLVPKAAKAIGISFSDLSLGILNNAYLKNKIVKDVLNKSA